jgi:hypothetical protein
MSQSAGRTPKRRAEVAALPQPIASESRVIADIRDAPVFQADVDGARVCIVARDEVVIACGPASITLRRNGRVIIRGTHVETRAAGTNRIRGGQVRVN